MSEIDYHEKIDELEVYSSKDRYKTSIRDEDYIFHISHDGKIIGVEILNASKNLQLESKVLKTLEEAEIQSRISRIDQNRTLLEVGILLLGKDTNYQKEIRIRNLQSNPIKA